MKMLSFLSVFSLFSSTLAASKLYNNDGSARNFMAISYVSGPPGITFTNATLVYWDALDKPCLYVYGPPLCFLDELAALFPEHYDFLVLGWYAANSVSPAGWPALTDYKEKGRSLPHYDSDLVLTAEDAKKVSLDLFPEMTHPYHSNPFLPTLVTISVVFGLLSLGKLGYSLLILRNHWSVRLEFTAATKLLLVEIVASLFSMSLAVDPTGLLGIYNNAMFYLFTNILGILGYLSTFILTKAFDSALEEVEHVQAGKKHFHVGLLIVACVMPAYDYGASGLAVFPTSLLFTALNALVAVAFQVIFGRMFYGAKKRVLQILLDAKGGVVTSVQKRVQRMSKFLLYAGVAMFVYAGALLVLGATLAAGNGKILAFVILFYQISGVSVGMVQVLALPPTLDE